MKIATVAAACLAALVGCAAPTEPAPEASASASSALSGYQPFPARVEAPIGASRDLVCRDVPEKGTNPGYWAYMKDRKPWQYVSDDGLVFSCSDCMLDGQTITYPYVSLSTSSAIGVKFAPSPVPAGHPPPSLIIESTDARGMTFEGTTFEAPRSVIAKNADLRCSTGDIALIEPSKQTKFETTNVDLSGFVGNVTTTVPVTDLRMTGALGSVAVMANLTDARFDGLAGNDELTGMTGVVDFGPLTTVKGKFLFDHANASIEFWQQNTTFDGATISLGGAKGSIILSPYADVLMKGVTLEGVDGGMALSGTFEHLRFADKTAWPVGDKSLLPDASLTKVDFSGAILTPQAGETWPKDHLVLDDLKLTGGGFGPGVDLSKVSLRRAHLEGVDFGKVVLTRLDGQHAIGADFQEAHLDGASFVGPEDNRAISGVDFTGAGVRGADFTGVSGAATFDCLDAGTIVGTTKTTTFARATLTGSHFARAGIQYVSFAGAHLEGVDFAGATADFANFSGATFGANQTLADVASLRAPTFDGADLRGANLTGVDLSSLGDKVASFTDALLCDTTLTNTHMRGARLTHVKLDVDGLVKLPNGDLVACTPGAHAGLDTSSNEKTTVCADATSPAGGASCTDAQMKQEGVPACAHPGRKIHGAACASDCDCASATCGASTKTCE